MPASIDVLHPDRPKRVLMVASNPAVSTVTGWPVGFWWAELTHPWWEFTEHGYEVVIASPDGGALRGDSWNEVVHRVLTGFYEAGKVTGVICHATAVLLTARSTDGRLLVEGKTWTGFANAEEQVADEFVGRRIQPFWIEDEARTLDDTNFIVDGRFKAHAVRDGNLVTGQQQYSGVTAARSMIGALGI
jgi:putative intracellular protease/amidase